MAARRLMLLWICILLLGYSNKMLGEEADAWTVEPFYGSLSGKTVTVTRQLWAEGPLMPDGSEAPLRPETLFALRCLREEMRAREMRLSGIADHVSAYTADFMPPEIETEQWVKENVWRFGLIVDETAETKSILRLRCVGPIHAAAMRALDMALEEYLLFLRQAGQVSLKRNGRIVAWIFCLPVQEAVSFALPEGAAWEISGDNAGNVIVAIHGDVDILGRMLYNRGRKAISQGK